MQNQINNLQNEITKAQQIQINIEQTEKKLKDVEQQMDNTQKEYITILGIFASIVLAFTGGIAFSSSVLSNIAQVSVYRTIIITLLIGLVLLNTLFSLFYYINLIINKNSTTKPIIITNVIIIVMLLLTIFAWQYGLVEKRNKLISQQNEINYTELNSQ